MLQNSYTLESEFYIVWRVWQINIYLLYFSLYIYDIQKFNVLLMSDKKKVFNTSACRGLSIPYIWSVETTRVFWQWSVSSNEWIPRSACHITNNMTITSLLTLRDCSKGSLENRACWQFQQNFIYKWIMK